MSEPISILNVDVLTNPSTFNQPFNFQITCQCKEPGVKEELEWKLIYVGSSENQKYDQVLDSILVGPVPIGISKFIFQAPAPNPDLIPVADIVGATVILLVGLYKDKEFIKIGYYVNSDYGTNEELTLNPPNPPRIDLLQRNILSDKPIVTRLDIPWDDASFDEKILKEKEILDAKELAEVV